MREARWTGRRHMIDPMPKIQVTIRLDGDWSDVDLRVAGNHVSEGVDERLDGLFPAGERDWSTVYEVIDDT